MSMGELVGALIGALIGALKIITTLELGDSDVIDGPLIAISVCASL